ncbi:hypothetical protein [Streptomyces sp. NPDC058653]|uniref:hypothetical protein n=1 Tax=Streptomyces sp. NPDC058653 TaxID=3346576 RepID=UPI00364A010A
MRGWTLGSAIGDVRWDVLLLLRGTRRHPAPAELPPALADLLRPTEGAGPAR